MEYFIRIVGFSRDSWSIIFYTGKRSLVLSEEPCKRNPRLLLIAGRPDLRRNIIDIIRAIESKSMVSDAILLLAARMSNALFRCSARRRLKAVMERCLITYSLGDCYEMAVRCSIDYEVNQNFMNDVNKLRELTYRNGITLNGFMLFVQEMGGSEALDAQHLQPIFEELDEESSGRIKEEQFENFMKILSGESKKKLTLTRSKTFDYMQSLKNQIAETSRSSSSLRSTSLYVSPTARDSNGSVEVDFSKWQLLYCGGCKPVIKTLERMHDDLGICLKIEAFDW